MNMCSKYSASWKILRIKRSWIVTEFLNGGSLRPYCTGCIRMNSDQKLGIANHCWSALAYLHDTVKITHKDIKPENILLHHYPNGHLVAKMCDFGLAKFKTSTMSMTEETSIVGTFMYYPPEFAESKRNPRKADVYSLGATLCELFTNFHFWHNPIDRRRLEDCQILYKLVLVNQGIKDSDQGPGAEALDQCSDLPLMIKNALQLAVAFDRHRRPAASEMLKIFTDMESVSPDPIEVNPIDPIGYACQPNPVCISGQNVIQIQPNGSMQILSINGHAQNPGSIRCTFMIPTGIQSILHPSPGRAYPQTCCTVYLPKTKRGRIVARMLEIGFNRNALFEIGSSNTVNWSFRTDLCDGPHKFDADLIGNWVYNFKDKHELIRLESALSAIGIDRKMITDI